MGNKMHVQILLWSFVLVVISPSPSTSFVSSEGSFSNDSSFSRPTSFILANQIQSAKKKSRRKRKNISAFSSRKRFRGNELTQSSAPATIAFYSVGSGGGGGDGGGGGNGSLEGQMSSSGNDIKSERNQHSALGISVSLFVTYLTVMGAKCALPSTLSFLTSPNSGLSHPSSSTVSRHDVLSRLLALSTLSIATGKLALGPIIDSLGGVASLQIALSTLALCLGLIGFGNQTCPTLKILSIYWVIVDFAFSSCWAACVKTIREYTNEKKWAKEIGRLAVAARSGNAISFAFFAWLLQWAPKINHNGVAEIDSSWRWVFRASSAIQLIPLAMLSHFGKIDSKTYSSRGLDVLEESSQSTEQGSKMKKSLTILRNQSQTLAFWLHLISRSITMVLVSFLLFIPTFMKQCFEMSSASSARVGSFFAVGCLSSVSIFADKAYPSSLDSAVSKSIHKHKAYSMLTLLTISTVTLALQSSFLRNTISISSNVGTLLMFLWGFSLAIPFYLPSSMFALKRGGIEGSATIVDAFDAVGFVLLATFNGYVARIVGVSGMNGLLMSRKQAWLPVFQLMMKGSMIATLTLFLAVFSEGLSDRY